MNFYFSYTCGRLLENPARRIFIIIMLSALGQLPIRVLGQLKAGTAKVDITNTDAGLVNDPLYAKALALDDGSTKMVIITLDVVAIEEIGPIKNGYLAKVRSQIQKDLGVKPSNVLINVSHCHGIVREDVDQLTVQAVKKAFANMSPVDIGVGKGHEDRIMENRRFKMKDGSQTDMRRAYSLPPDEQIAQVGPVDPEIGILRLDKKNGETLAVVYNFAMHPIEGVPNGGNTADVIGFASKVIEQNLSEGTMALFLQGCGGDINPVSYKGVDNPPDAEPLGNMLGLSVLKALKNIHSTKIEKIKLINETMDLPRANFAPRIEAMQAYQAKLLQSLRGTNINLKTFISLIDKHNYSEDFPSFYSHRYLHDELVGRQDLARMDSLNKKDMDNYRQNIYTMEELTRVKENLSLLKKNHAAAAGRTTINVEMLGVKIGDFVLVTFPGELTVQIGLNIKKKSPGEFTFVAGYTNGYIYYAPTAEQLRNTGGAQEDCDTLLAPEWQALYEERASQMLRKL
jgi:hypothetical protein